MPRTGQLNTVARGELFGIYPEGTRSLSGKLEVLGPGRPSREEPWATAPWLARCRGMSEGPPGPRR